MPESSGLARSTHEANLFWTHDDSGGRPALYGVRLSAEARQAECAPVVAVVTLRGARNVDWEDLATGPDRTLYVFDGGDNPPCNRTDKRIYRIVEPELDANASRAQLTVNVEALRFEYPDPAHPAKPATQASQRYDAEALAVEPTTGDVYVVTKRTHFNLPAARVYRLPASRQRWTTGAVHVLEFVTDLTATAPGFITGMDISPDADELALRTYGRLYLYRADSPSKTFNDLLRQRPIAVDLPGEPQGEAVAIVEAGRRYLTTSEQAGGLSATPIFEVVLDEAPPSP